LECHKKRDKIRKLNNFIIKDIENNLIRKCAENVLMMLVLLKIVKNSYIESAIESDIELV